MTIRQADLPSRRVIVLPSQGLLRIGVYPHRRQVNPYLRLFYEALRPYGIEPVPEFRFERRCVNRRALSLDAVHLHWPELVWQFYVPKLLNLPPRMRGAYRVRQVTRSIRRRMGVRVFLKTLQAVKGHGLKVIWTLHNLAPHEGASAIDGVAFHELARSSDLVICHNETARCDFVERYAFDGQAVVMPHGNYDGVYPPPRDPEATRQALGLSAHLPVVSCLGGLRDYKGLDLACDAVRRLGGRVQLLVAGEPHRTFDLKSFERAATTLPYVRVVARMLTDQEFADYTAASDLILLPYRHITGSGALMAALTLGRSVVASDLPFFREVLRDHPLAGSLFPPGDAARLAEAIEARLKLPKTERDAAARELADRYRWDRVVQPVTDVLSKWKTGRTNKSPTSQ